MRSRDLIPTIYGPSLRRVLRFRRSAVFLLACGMHAAGHACLALTAARCAGLLGGGGTGLLAAGSAGEGSNVGWLADPLALAALGLGAVAVKGLGGAWASFEEGRIVGEVGAGLRMEVLDGWLALHRLRSPRQRDQGGRPPGARPAAALAALTEHVRELETGLGVGVLGAVRAVAQLVPLVAALVLLAPRLAGVAAAAFGGFSLVLGRARHAWKAANARGAAEREALLAAADEAVKHAELWTTFGAEGRVRSHVAAIGARLARRGARLAASAAGLSAANEVLGAAALVLAIAAGRAGWLGAGGEAVLLPFAVTFFLAYRPIRDLTDARLALARASVSAEAIAPLLAPVPAPAPARPRGSEHVWTPAELAIDRLLLAHGDGAPISLRADAGSIVAVVGSTGSGKTTLLRTLLGLEGALAGEVRFGGRRIDAASAGPEARPFAWVPQEAPLLADTLAANVALAPGAADPRGALDAVGAGPLHEALGATPVGAGGRALSGGERQWVSLARAVATRQPVLLLDEPTSGLDPASQARVLEAIARLRGERTVLLVTHREEPLAIADQVIRLDRPVSGTSGPAS